VIGWRLEPFGGPVGGVASAKTSWSRRDGWLLRLMDGERTLGLGEATPLPGFGNDTLALAETELRALPPPPEALEDGLALAAACRSPSARFAVESALFDAHARARGEPLSRLLARRAPEPVERRVLIGKLGDAELFARARAASARGARRWKVKSDGSDVERDGAILRELAPASVCVDFNGCLTDPDALAAYAHAGVSSVEEPTRDLLALGACALPWFADESLVAHERELVASPACAGVVLKPTVLGGFVRCLALGQRARDAGKHVVVGHAFEGPVALAGCAALALALGAEAAVDAHAALAGFVPARLAEIPNAGHPLSLVPASEPGLAVRLEG
jgi:L-alanine-DL-glutamate epimerase-like enolase superfamily enzyme